jgi:hypothetical protein
MAKPIFPLRLRIISAFGPVASLVAVVLRWCVIHKDDQDFDLALINYAVAWLPFAISILVAFVPDMRRAHIAWRSLVILAGLGYSFLLFKQQYLAMDASHKDQRAAIAEAVSKSNAHSDQKIESVRDQLKEQSQRMEGKLEGLSGQITKSESELTGSIGKVSVPPIRYAQLQFSFYSSSTQNMPVLVEGVKPGKDGDFTLDFFVTNIADEVTAKSGEIWIVICDECVFAKEPEGFDKPAGSNEATRHKLFGSLNPGVTLAKMTIEVKLNLRSQAFQVAFKYSCETCGKMKDWQKLTVQVLPT